MSWPDVEATLVAAHHYWVVSVRRDGRPHAVPKDGLWINGAWFYGGSDDTVHARNIETHDRVVMHLSDPVHVVIVEGTVDTVTTDERTAAELVAASRAKYGYAPPASAYARVQRLTPARVLAWKQFPTDATRFDFNV